MHSSIFRAYDIRGKYPEEINEKTVEEITRALARYFKRGKIVVGHDNRLSSASLYRTILKTLAVSNRALVQVPIGLMTTPMRYFLMRKLKARGALMVSASHNPKQFNGLKVLKGNYMEMSGVEIQKLVMRKYVKASMR